jgi:hypothetical protein
MKSRLADQARQDQNNAVRALTPEQRLKAFLQHNQLVHELFLAGRAAARMSAEPELRDASE